MTEAAATDGASALRKPAKNQLVHDGCVILTRAGMGANRAGPIAMPYCPFEQKTRAGRSLRSLDTFAGDLDTFGSDANSSTEV